MGKDITTPCNSQIGRVIRDLHLPLSNLEYTIEQHLLSHGLRIDAETRLLLAAVRDCVGHLAQCTLDLTDPAGPCTEVGSIPQAPCLGIDRAA